MYTWLIINVIYNLIIALALIGVAGNWWKLQTGYKKFVQCLTTHLFLMKLSFCCRLLDQVPKPMADNSFTWVKLLVPMAVHPAVEVREKVIDLFEKNLAMLTSLKGLAHTIAGDFKTVSILYVQSQIYTVRGPWANRIWGPFITNVCPCV